MTKPDAAELLAKKLAAPGYVPRVIAMGTNTDPYQPLEKKMRITRSILEVLRDFLHPVAIITKSPLILRDADILSEMAAIGPGQGSALYHHPGSWPCPGYGAARRNACPAAASHTRP